MPSFETWAVEVGEESPETLAKMERLFDFVINSTDEEFRDQFEEYFDLDSALNYYVFSDITYLADNLGKNMLLATYDGMVWYLSLYDLDTSWGTRWDGFDVGNYDTGLLKLKRNNLFARMEKVFPELLAERYFELREDILSNEHMMEELEAFRDKMMFENEIEAYEKNSLIPYLFNTIKLNTFQEEFRSKTTMDGFEPGADMEPAKLSDFEEGYSQVFRAVTCRL